MNGSLITKRNIRDPIEYVVDEYFRNKKLSSSQRSIKNSSSDIDTINSNFELPDLPITLFRNDFGEVNKIVHGNLDLLTSNQEGDPLIWQEEIIKENNIVTKIITTFPDGSTAETIFKSDENNQINEIR